MSTRRRIVRISITFLIILAIGSIGSAGFLGASTIGPKKAFAATVVSDAGTLGVGERTIAPLTESVTTTEKVDVEPSSAATTAATALATPAVKRVSTKADYVRATAKATTSGSKVAAMSIGSAFTKRWQRAVCSWYGPGFYGNTMAGGGRLQRNSMVVAHKRLPFGTRVQFWHKGRTVIATVRDRGPYVSGRSFDLGPGTAKALGFGGVGTLRYRIIGRS